MTDAAITKKCGSIIWQMSREVKHIRFTIDADAKVKKRFTFNDISHDKKKFHKRDKVLPVLVRLSEDYKQQASEQLYIHNMQRVDRIVFSIDVFTNG